jgi:hypothetical protein
VAEATECTFLDAVDLDAADFDAGRIYALLGVRVAPGPWRVREASP